MSRFESFLYRRILLWPVLVLGLLGIALALLFAAAVTYAAAGGTRFAGLTQPLLDVATLPIRALKALTTDTLPITREAREPLAPGLWRNPQGGLDDPGYVLLSRYDKAAGRYVVELLRLADGRVVHRYAPDVAAINAQSTVPSRLRSLVLHAPAQYRMMHPVLMPDGGIVFHGDSPEVRVDACGKLMWAHDGLFHHANEVDADGNIWTPGRNLASSVPHTAGGFREDEIVKLSPQGKLLYQESVATILANNNLTPLWRSRPYTDDPFHLNDIQPVLESSKYWDKGDVFLSLRNLSLLLLYRPSTGKVLWWHQGPWSMQHDVDVLDDHRIGVFDNSVQSAPDGPIPRAQNGDFVVGHNNILVYDFRTGTISSPFGSPFAKWDIRTITQGLFTALGNGDAFVEETNYGRLLRIAPDGTIRWQYISTDTGGRRFELGWSRYVNSQAEAAGIRAATTARCS